MDDPDIIDEMMLKELFWPTDHLIPRESRNVSRIRIGFTDAGYLVRRIEELEAPPVIVVRMVRKTAPEILVQRELFLYIGALLKGIGFDLPRSSLTVHREGTRVLVALPSGTRGPTMEEILAERVEIEE